MGLKRLAKKRGLDFSCFDIEDLKRGWFSGHDVSIVVLHAAHIKIAQTTTSAIKARYPGAKLVTLGSDSIYYTRRYPDEHRGLLVDPRGYEFVRPEDVDLHLDLMQEVVDKLNGDGFRADRWLWTACEAGLELAKEVMAERAPPIDLDVICYANPNVSAPGNYRPTLTRELSRRGRSIQWGGTTPFVGVECDTLKSIYRLYRRARVCLGTSSPSWTPCRTMKGWRDWIAPALGVPLIYDDILEMDELPVEKFAYRDFDHLARILARYDCPDYRQGVVDWQMSWLEKNTLEKQFERIFDQHGLWPEGERND